MDEQLATEVSLGASFLSYGSASHSVRARGGIGGIAGSFALSSGTFRRADLQVAATYRSGEREDG